MIARLTKHTPWIEWAFYTIGAFFFSWGAYLALVNEMRLNIGHPDATTVFVAIMTDPRLIIFFLLLTWLVKVTRLTVELRYKELLIRTGSTLKWTMYVVREGLLIWGATLVILLFFVATFALGVIISGESVSQLEEGSPFTRAVLQIVLLTCTFVVLHVLIAFISLLMKRALFVYGFVSLLFSYAVFIFWRYAVSVPPLLNSNNYLFVHDKTMTYIAMLLGIAGFVLICIKLLPYKDDSYES